MQTFSLAAQGPTAHPQADKPMTAPVHVISVPSLQAEGDPQADAPCDA